MMRLIVILSLMAGMLFSCKPKMEAQSEAYNPYRKAKKKPSQEIKKEYAEKSKRLNKKKTKEFIYFKKKKEMKKQ